MELRVIPDPSGHGAAGVPAGVISSWEAETGTALPEDYKQFLRRVDGGYPYPNTFFPDLPKDRFFAYAEGAFLSVLYDWESVQRHWRGEVFGAGTPPGMLIVGNEPGGLEILLSARPQDRGRVYAWYHTTAPWGTDGNAAAALFPLAGSFSEFLGALGDTPDNDGLDFVGGEGELAARAIAVPLAAR